MATTHQLSVIANSCVKPPVNPETGLSVTLGERYANDLRQTWDGYGQEYDGGTQEWDEGRDTNGGRLGMLNKTDTMLQDFTADYGTMSDVEFYKRLQDLKGEHKKTLHICETLYTQKVGGLQSQKSGDFSVTNGSSHVHDHVNQNDRMAGTGHSDHQLFESLNNSYNALRRSAASPVRDQVRDMSRPPTGRSSRSRPQSAKPGVSVRRSQEYDQEQVQAGYYSDEDHWKPISACTTDVELSRDEGPDGSYHHHHHHHHHSQRHNDSKHSSLSQVEDMWDNFSVDEYAPTKIRQRSSSLSRASSASERKQRGGDDVEDWRHRITLPKPFNMSLRESSKIKEKSQTLLEYEARMALEKKVDEQECQKKFKAKPVPAHVYMPLFDEKMEQMESRRKSHRENSKELLKSQEKPFNFTKREEEKKKYRSTTKMDRARSEVQKRPPTGFKARPFPAHLFDGTVTDQLQEEEEYRKIRVQMRAEELLKTASLPPNMAAMGKDYVDGKSRQKIYADRAKKAGMTTEHKFQPRINETLPDFEEQHRNMLWELSQKRSTKEATVCKPFNLRTERVASKRHKVYEDIDNDASTLKSKTWSFNKSSKLASMRSMSNSMDAIPTKMTTSSTLRLSANRTKLQQELDTQLAELERERQQRLKEKKIKKYIAERVALNDNSKDLETTLKTKIKEYKQTERERRSEYTQMLNEIDERIEKRPLLFERALQANAKRAAERKYEDTLRRVGLDGEYIVTKGKEATEDDLTAVSDDEGDLYSRRSSTRCGSARSHRSRTASHSESRRYSDDYEEGNRTSEGSDMDRD